MILRLNSRGPLVQQLQEFLGIVPADGIFGKNTQKIVKEWQAKNGLKADGVVGPMTWNMMGIASTDRVEVSTPQKNVFTYEKRHLPKGEWFEGPTEKKWIFLHHTAGWENPFNTIDGWARDSRGSIATEWVVGGQSIKDASDDFDGRIVQAFPSSGWGWHLGTGNNPMHQQSVGIEICGFGGLHFEGFFRVNPKTGKNLWVKGQKGIYYTWSGQIANPDQIEFLSEPFRGHAAWHRFSPKQIESTRLLILEIAKRDGIDPRKGIVEEIKKLGPFRAFNLTNRSMCETRSGLWLHTNVRLDKNDPYPSQGLIDMLQSL